MNEICVVHLVRAYNGIQPLRNFLESYKLNPGGIAHDLVILFKGFESEEQLLEYRVVLKPFKYKELHVKDEGFDITAYFAVPRLLDYKYYCFLNSFSVLLDLEWLLKMYRYISKDEVGLVGATGSYQSLYAPLDSNQRKLMIERSIFWTVRYVIIVMVNKVRFEPYFDKFPNFHVRSNAFMIKNEIIKNIVIRRISNKMDAYKCESGKQSIAKQVMGLGKSALVIGADGKAYEKDDWWESNTFWRANQENLLVSDNQTRAYANSDHVQKILFSMSAWGAKAWPIKPY